MVSGLLSSRIFLIKFSIAYRQKRRKVRSSESQQPDPSSEVLFTEAVRQSNHADLAPPSSRVVFDAVEVSPLQSIDKQKYARLSALGSTDQLDPSSSPQFSITRPGRLSSDHDYSMWDTGISSQHIRELKGYESPMLGVQSLDHLPLV